MVKMENLNRVENIDQAFLQLEFSLKLLNYVELRKIKKKDFDTDVLIADQNMTFNQNSFNTYNDLINGAINNFNISLGFTSIVLDYSLAESEIKISQNDNEGKIRTLVSLIRNAYAHNMMFPVWQIDRRKKIPSKFSIALENRSIDIDLSNREGKPFDVANIGGHKTYFDIKNEVCKIIENRI